jgi:hypothetical protein
MAKLKLEIELSEKIIKWIEEQALLRKTSVSKHIVEILSQAMERDRALEEGIESLWQSDQKREKSKEEQIADIRLNFSNI